MKKLIPLFILIFCSSTLAQYKPVLTGLPPLILDDSTFEDARAYLGDPIKDKENQTFIPLAYSEWFNMPKNLRKVKFKAKDGDDVTLYFRNGKLVIVDLDLKENLRAAELVDIYEEKFYPLVGNFIAGITPTDLVEEKMEVYYPEKFPLEYDMGAASAKIIGLAHVSIDESKAESTVEKVLLPGLVSRGQFISRTLEK